jgi:fatty-acyl-CoA synthase
MHIIDELPLTPVGKIFKPTLQMKEVENCITSVISDLRNAATCTVNVTQDKRLGILATIKTDASVEQIEQLSTQLGKFAFQYRVETN